MVPTFFSRIQSLKSKNHSHFSLYHHLTNENSLCDKWSALLAHYMLSRRVRSRKALGSCRDLGAISLSLCAWVQKWFEVKIFTSNHFRVKPTKTHGQLKSIFGKFIFHAQPNTRIYGKAFPEVIWSQNKHSLYCKPHTTGKFNSSNVIQTNQRKQCKPNLMGV